MFICRALIKYGYLSFRLEILEYCEPDKRFDWVNFYINECKPEYNVLKFATLCLLI